MQSDLTKLTNFHKCDRNIVFKVTYLRYHELTLMLRTALFILLYSIRGANKLSRCLSFHLAQHCSAIYCARRDWYATSLGPAWFLRTIWPTFNGKQFIGPKDLAYQSLLAQYIAEQCWAKWKKRHLDSLFAPLQLYIRLSSVPFNTNGLFTFRIECVILLHENQHCMLHCSDKFNVLKDSMQLYHCSKPDKCQGRSFKPLNQSGYCNSCMKSIKDNIGLTIMSSLNIMDSFPSYKRFLLQNLPKLIQVWQLSQ